MLLLVFGKVRTSPVRSINFQSQKVRAIFWRKMTNYITKRIQIILRCVFKSILAYLVSGFVIFHLWLIFAKNRKKWKRSSQFLTISLTKRPLLIPCLFVLCSRVTGSLYQLIFSRSWWNLYFWIMSHRTLLWLSVMIPKVFQRAL
jgi:hypothetical protein